MLSCSIRIVKKEICLKDLSKHEKMFLDKKDKPCFATKHNRRMKNHIDDVKSSMDWIIGISLLQVCLL